MVEENGENNGPILPGNHNNINRSIPSSSRESVSNIRSILITDGWTILNYPWLNNFELSMAEQFWTIHGWTILNYLANFKGSSNITATIGAGGGLLLEIERLRAQGADPSIADDKVRDWILSYKPQTEGEIKVSEDLTQFELIITGGSRKDNLLASAANKGTRNWNYIFGPWKYAGTISLDDRTDITLDSKAPNMAAQDTAAKAKFQDSLLDIGWGVFEVQTNGNKAQEYFEKSREDVSGNSVSLERQGFAAGFLEGIILLILLANNH